MSNLKDFIGGNTMYGGGNEKPTLVTDGVNTISEPNNTYIDFDSYAKMISLVCNGYDQSTNGIAFDNRYFSEKNIIIENGVTVVNNVQQDFYGIECTNLIINGMLGNPFGGYIAGSPIGFAGCSNLMDGVWDFMPKGGGGNIGYSESIQGDRLPGPLCFIVADSVSGEGTISMPGSKNDASAVMGDGGGIIIICTKSWSGTVSLEVRGGTAGDGDPAGNPGSYCILKINSDNTLTLMVHNDQNNGSAVLNGQTPVHGADASIAW